MKKSKGIVVLLLTLILTVFFCFTAAVGIGPTGTGAAKHINTGLDLAGGVSITYQAKESNPTSEEMSDTIYKLQKRVEQYSTEAQVYQEGSDRITVEIPGVTDADTILNDLGKPGSLYFITKEDADGNQNFTTGQDGYVLSRTMDEIKESGSVVLEGSDVADAQGGAIQNQNTSAKEYVVSLTLTSDGENSGKTKFAEATKNNVGKQIAIVYDNNIISAPNVNEEISGGKAQISVRKLFFACLYLSTFTFGGGYVIVTLLKEKFVDHYHWIEEDEMLDLVAIAQSSPGAIAVNGAIIVGYKLAGIPGMLVSVIGAIIPPMVILSVISVFYDAFCSNYYIAALLKGMTAGVGAVIMSVVYDMGKNVVKSKDWVNVVIMIISFCLSYFLNVNIIYIILSVAVFGMVRTIVKGGRDK